jgi:hypothetical protein|tara:strand:- start:207 stop:890 length:684 start_codon:yes stop_codon:yes gene_type:complete
MEDSKFVLDKKDIGFFLPFGALISLMIWLLDGVSVPAQMDRGFWQDLFFDHIPFGTIGLLFVVSCLLDLMTVYLPKGRVGEFFKSQKEHIADRVWQLSSPAIFTIIGFSVPIFILYLVEDNFAYLGYVITFVSFSFAVWAMAFFARISVIESKGIKVKIGPKWGAVLSAIIAISVFLTAYTDTRPKKVEVSFNFGTYTQIEEKAKDKGLSVKEFIQLSTLSKLSETN